LRRIRLSSTEIAAQGFSGPRLPNGLGHTGKDLKRVCRWETLTRVDAPQAMTQEVQLTGGLK